jgi:hypothetical protein
MGDETNGDRKGRLDRIEETVKSLLNEHIQFHEEHRHLLKAQVILYDSMQKLTDAQRKTDESLARLSTAHEDLLAAQRNADDRMAALLITVDDIIRHPKQ